jgi:hypothetical protein
MSESESGSHFIEFAKFMQMAPDERREHVTDLLADIAEVWMDDPAGFIMIGGMISAFRAILDAVNDLADYITENTPEGEKPKINPHVGGTFIHMYSRMARDFATMTALTDVKRSFRKEN